MNFRLVERQNADLETLYDDFVDDYIFGCELRNEEIRVKYNLTHREFKELADLAKKNNNLSRRQVKCRSAKYYYWKGNGYMIAKYISGEYTYLGFMNSSRENVEKIVELCKKASWDMAICKDIIKNWRQYVI